MQISHQTSAQGLRKLIHQVALAASDVVFERLEPQTTSVPARRTADPERVESIPTHDQVCRLRQSARSGVQRGEQTGILGAAHDEGGGERQHPDDGGEDQEPRGAAQDDHHDVPCTQGGGRVQWRQEGYATHGVALSTAKIMSALEVYGT